MPPIRIYSTLICPYCIRAKALLRQRGIAYENIDVTADPAMRAWLAQQTGRRTVPQIFLNGAHIGGFAELRALDSSGELARAVAGPA
jgi:glutaredoxin 3